MKGGDVRPDIDAAKDRMRSKLGSRREIRKLAEHLWDGENVQRMTSGMYEGKSGLLVLTDRRLLFLYEGWVTGKSEDFALSKISSVQWKSGLVLGRMTAFASGNKAVISQLQKDDGRDIVDIIRGRLSPEGLPLLAERLFR